MANSVVSVEDGNESPKDKTASVLTDRENADKVVNTHNNITPQQTDETDMDAKQIDETSETSSCCDNSLTQGNMNQPPIYVKHISSQEILKLYKNNKLKVNFTIKNSSDKSFMLKTYSAESYQDTIDCLDKLEVEFFTFTQKEKKIRSILLKGLHADTSCEEVFHEISRLNLEQVKVHKVSVFPGKPRNGITFIVQLSADSNTKNLTQTKYLHHQIVKWEQINKTEPPQCRRCQRISHVASGCHMAYRCVKCIHKHEPGQCSLKNKINEEVQCVLCGLKGHPASYRGCEVRIKEIEKYNSRRKQGTTRDTYANMVKNQSSTSSAVTMRQAHPMQHLDRPNPTRKQVDNQTQEQGTEEYTPSSNINSIDQFINSPYAKYSNTESRLNTIEVKFDNILNKLEGMFDGIKSELNNVLKQEYHSLHKKIDENSQKINHLYQMLNQNGQTT
uniref:Pre-C2HC domain-containing protein n=1 Tax=Trichogramma kaykai TaxID=54128 RepID=A0ABD2XJ57_9HYME